MVKGVLGFLLMAVMSVSSFPAEANDLWRCRTQLAPDQVRVFEMKDYVGKCVTWRVPQGHKWLGIQDARINRKPARSLKVGKGLKVMVFQHTHLACLGNELYCRKDKVQGNLGDKRVVSLLAFNKDLSHPGGLVVEHLHKDKDQVVFQRFLPGPGPGYVRQLYPYYNASYFGRIRLHLDHGVTAVQVYEGPRFTKRNLVLPGPGVSTKKIWLTEKYGFTKMRSIKVFMHNVRMQPKKTYRPGAAAVRPRPGAIKRYNKPDSGVPPDGNLDESKGH